MAALWHRSPGTVATARLTIGAVTRYVELASSEVVTRSSFGDSGPSRCRKYHGRADHLCPAYWARVVPAVTAPQHWQPLRLVNGH
jgi:hypothetical protein